MADELNGHDPEVSEILGSEMGEMEKVRALYAKGITRKQLIQEFAFSKRTVYDAVPVAKEQEAREQETGTNHSSLDHADNGYSNYPMSRKVPGGGEIMNPEVLMRQLAGDSPREHDRLDGMLVLRAAMLMVMDLTSIQEAQSRTEERRANALVKLLRETREESKQGNQQLAKDTAEHALTQVANTLEEIVNRPRPGGQQEKPQQQQKPSGVQDRMDKYLGMMFDMMEGMFMPGQGPGGQLEGWEYEDRSSSTAPPAGGAPAPEQQEQGPPPGWETETIKEEDDGIQSGDVRDEPGTDGPGAGGGQTPEDGGQEIPPDGEG